MGRITSTTGLISGLKSADIIDQLMALEARPKDLLQTRIEATNAQKLAFTDLSTRLTSLRINAQTLKKPSTFTAAKASSSNEDVITASAGLGALPGTYQFQVARLVASQQSITSGFADYDTAKVGTGTLTIELGGGDLASPMNLSQLNGGTGIQRGSFRITDRSGKSALIDVTAAVTLDDVVKKINNALDINVRASIGSDGLVLNDLSGGIGSLSVNNVGATHTATDLGIAGSIAGATLAGSDIAYLGSATLLSQLNDGRGVRVHGTSADFRVTFGDASTIDVNLSAARTVGEAITAINAAGTGKLTASISGDEIQLTDISGAGGSFTVAALNSSTAAADLGIAGVGTTTLMGQRIYAGPGTVLLSSLKGGSGLTLGSFTLQNRAGVAAPVDLTGATTVSDVLEIINSIGLNVTASLNSSGNGILLTDNTGGSGSIVIADGVGSTIATQLGIAGTFAASTVSGANLQRQYINENTLLSDYNGGKGVTAGKISITNSLGAVTTVDLSGATTLKGVISKINAAGAGATASINANGDGLLITDTVAGSAKLKIDDVSGTSATDLNIKGTATATTIDGTFEKTLTLNAADTLTTVQNKINALSFGVRASILNDGTGSSPYRLSLTALNSGQRGRVVFDAGTSSLTTQTLVDAQDAAVFVGSSNAAQPLLITGSHDQFAGVIPGVTIELHGVSTSPVTVNISRTSDKALEQVKGFTESFNALVDKIGELTEFDVDPSKRGILLGDNTIRTIQSQLYNGLNTVVASAGRYRLLADVGVKLVDGAKLELDEDKFNTAFATDPDSVQRLFTAVQTTTVGATTTTTPLGVGHMLEKKINNLIDPTNGVITRENHTLDDRTQTFQERISHLDTLLTAKRTRLETQFAQLEGVLAGLQAQQSAISQITSLSTLSSGSKK